MRVELYGCAWDGGVASYSMPQGDKRGTAYEFYDWTYDGDATEADGSFVRYVFDDAGTRHSWLVLLAPNANRYQMPVIPERLAAYRPTPQASYEDVQVLLIETDQYQDFDAFRKSDGPFFLQSATFQGDLRFAIAFENLRP